MRTNKKAATARRVRKAAAPVSEVQVRVPVPLSELAPPPNAADEEDQLFVDLDTLHPRYSPYALATMVDRSAALRPNIDAYAVNIASSWRFEPTIDLAAADADAKVRDLIMLENLIEHGETLTPNDASVQSRLVIARNDARRELLRLEAWFNLACFEGFGELMVKTRIELETFGNAAWEVTRRGDGQLGALKLVPWMTMRLCPMDTASMRVDLPRRISPISVIEWPTWRRFRRYVQRLHHNVRPTYFKELDDPRTLSADTGRFYESEEAMRQAEPKAARLATEILHFTIFNPLTHPYGGPRWAGASPSVAGAREAEELNCLYFSNRCMPDYAILVSGSVLADKAVTRIEKYLEGKMRGPRSFTSPLILEAQSPTSSDGKPGRVTIEIKPLTNQPQDATFQNYIANVDERVGQQFRLPGIFRGNSSDLNRATAESAIALGNGQVFEPERLRFAHVINTRIMPLIGATFFELKLGAPPEVDATELSAILAQGVTNNILTPADARDRYGAILGAALPKNDAIDAWANQPLAALLAQAQAQAAKATEPAEAAKATRQVLQLRRALADADEPAELKQARNADAAKVIRVPKAEFESWLDPNAKPTTRLSSMQTHEVSLVKHGANGRRFVSVK